MKEDAVVSKQLLQDSGMCDDVSYVRHVLRKFTELLWRRKAGVPPWGNNMASGNQQTNIQDIVWFQKISIPPPPPKASDFPGGRGVNLPNFPVGRGGEGHHREIFPESSRDA